MANKELIARTLDVTARGFDLVTAFANTVNSSGPLTNIVLEIGKWLGREGLSENDLHMCLEKARGLVIANANAHPFYENVLAGARKRAVGPFFVQPSGSLGRLLTHDPLLRWMVSSAACFFDSQDMDGVALTLCAFILSPSLPNPERDFSETLHTIPDFWIFLPVVKKLVSSIWLNVVNSGVVQNNPNRDLVVFSLPVELQPLCSTGHHILPHILGRILFLLRSVSGEVVIRSQEIVNNLVLWLCYHFRGQFRVVVGSNIVYDKVLGDDGGAIEYRIESECESGCKTETVDLRIEFFLAGRMLKPVTAWHYSCHSHKQAQLTRKPLYHHSLISSQNPALEDVRDRVRRTALTIISWILNLRVSKRPPLNVLVLGFTVTLDADEGDTDALRVRDMLARIPSIYNKNWGPLGDTVAFAIPVEFSKQDFNEIEEMYTGEQNLGFQEALTACVQFFPVLHELSTAVSKCCSCYNCCLNLSPVLLKPGCLRHKAFFEVLRLIAHSISDSFGSNDASGRYVQENDDMGVLRILTSLTVGNIRWNDWFNTATQVLLGQPIRTSEVGFSGICAVQYGNLAVLAPWLDNTCPFTVRGCFGFEVVQGKLGLYGPHDSSFQVLEEDMVVINVDRQGACFTGSMGNAATYVGSLDAPILDTCTLDATFLLSGASGFYKLLMRVTSGQHSRFVLPILPLRHLLNRELASSCKHPSPQLLNPDENACLLSMSNYEELLAAGPVSGVKATTKTVCKISTILDSHLKYNTILAMLTDCHILDYPGGSCLACFLPTVTSEVLASRHIGKCVYIISRQPNAKVVSYADHQYHEEYLRKINGLYGNDITVQLLT